MATCHGGKYVYVNLGTSAVTRGSVTIQPGNDGSGTGTNSLPYRTIQAALNALYSAYPTVTYTRVIWVTGATSTGTMTPLRIPNFNSALPMSYDTGGSGLTPLTLYEEAITIYGDLEYTTPTAVTAVSWNAETVGASGMQQVVVSGLSVAADAMRGKLLLGTGQLQMAWIGRNDVTDGSGNTRLYLATDTALTGALRIATPIIITASSGSTTETIVAQNLQCSVAINGFRIESTNGMRSIGFREIFGALRLVGSDLERGYATRNIGLTNFSRTRLSSGAGPGNSADATYSTYSESGADASFDYCLFDTNSFLDINTTRAYYGSYFRGCNDMGHGGGTYLGNGMFDFNYCYVDGCTGQGSGHIWNYNGGPPCSIDMVSIHPGSVAYSGVCAREWGGLRVKNVIGTVGGYGMSIGTQASPMLGGSGTVRISTTTALTGTLGDFRLGPTVYTTGYTTLRALAAGERRMTNATYFATIWENS